MKTLSKLRPSFDLIHAHFLDKGFIGAAVKNRFDKPLVVTAHGSDVYNLPFKNSWYYNLAKYTLSKADQVIAVSEFNARKLLSLGLSANKLNIIPNGYDQRLFKIMSPSEARRRIEMPLNKKILLSIGNLSEEKGHTYLIDAMRIVAKDRNDVVLVIVGSGPLKEKLQKKTKELGLDGNVWFSGQKAHDEIPTWMNASDLFVLPSLEEGFPTVIPEAMACGKPIIATHVGGVPEAVSSSELGTIVPPRNPDALSQAILEGLRREWLQEKILDNAKNYSWDTLVKRILVVYTKALSNYA